MPATQANIWVEIYGCYGTHELKATLSVDHVFILIDPELIQSAMAASRQAVLSPSLVCSSLLAVAVGAIFMPAAALRAKVHELPLRASTSLSIVVLALVWPGWGRRSPDLGRACYSTTANFFSRAQFSLAGRRKLQFWHSGGPPSPRISRNLAQSSRRRPNLP